MGSYLTFSPVGGHEQALQVRDPATGEMMRIRRITIKLKVATRDGDTALHLLSTVLKGRGAAVHLARVYGKRWSIETALFAITTPWACESNTLGGGVLDVEMATLDQQSKGIAIHE